MLVGDVTADHLESVGSKAAVDALEESKVVTVHEMFQQ
jgi:hypothetical protein